MRFQYTYILLLSFILFFSAACEEEAPKPATQSARKAAKVKKVNKKAVAAEKKEEEKKEEKKDTYSYDPAGKKDPFFPILVEKKVEIEEVTAVDTGKPKTFLETLDLSQLKLVAVMVMGKKRVAMVEDPEGKGHSIYIGTPIGKSGGKVAAIEEGKVLIEEKYQKRGEVVSVIKELVIQTAEDKKR